MGQKGHTIVQKGLTMHEKRQKNRVFGPKENCFLAEFSLVELGGTAPLLLTDNHPAQKPLTDRGGTPPLNGQNPLKRF